MIRNKCLATLVFVALIMSVALVARDVANPWVWPVAVTRRNLENYREWIADYQQNQGRPPVTLSEAVAWRLVSLRKQQVTAKDIEDYSNTEGIERISRLVNGRSSSQEKRKLDGSGGWYYDPGTGSVRVNVTRRLFSYDPRYLLTPYAFDRPSDW